MLQGKYRDTKFRIFLCVNRVCSALTMVLARSLIKGLSSVAWLMNERVDCRQASGSGTKQ